MPSWTSGLQVPVGCPWRCLGLYRRGDGQEHVWQEVPAWSWMCRWRVPTAVRPDDEAGGSVDPETRTAPSQSTEPAHSSVSRSPPSNTGGHPWHLTVGDVEIISELESCHNSLPSRRHADPGVRHAFFTPWQTTCQDGRHEGLSVGVQQPSLEMLHADDVPDPGAAPPTCEGITAVWRVLPRGSAPGFSMKALSPAQDVLWGGRGSPPRASG